MTGIDTRRQPSDGCRLLGGDVQHYSAYRRYHNKDSPMNNYRPIISGELRSHQKHKDKTKRTIWPRPLLRSCCDSKTMLDVTGNTVGKAVLLARHSPLIKCTRRRTKHKRRLGKSGTFWLLTSDVVRQLGESKINLSLWL